jgi:predicted acylesterase/phospholipase RssA
LTSKPYSRLFKIGAGTSTGAILQAALSIRDGPHRLRPKYSASQLVDLYIQKAGRIFRRDGFLQRVVSVGPYGDRGRHELFQHYVGDTTLKDCLTDLIVPVYSSAHNFSPLIFKSKTAKADHSENIPLADLLMATTAAPTYFEPYRWKDAVYYDGGVVTNNPSTAAYTSALRDYGDVKPSQVTLWSLGTGEFCPNPLDPNASRHLLFWAKQRAEAARVVLDMPQIENMSNLEAIMGERCIRWQVWFDRPIRLDDYTPASVDFMVNVARAHMEEMVTNVNLDDSKSRMSLLLDKLCANAEF